MMRRVLLAPGRLVVLRKVDPNPAAQDLMAIADVRSFFSTPLGIKGDESKSPEFLRIMMVDQLHVRDITISCKKVSNICVFGVAGQPTNVDSAQVALLPSPPTWWGTTATMVLGR